MGLPDITQTGRTALFASKAAIATTGHNISNANTAGYSRQRVDQQSAVTEARAGDRRVIGTGTAIERVTRINDEYLEKQIRTSGRALAHMEEKEAMLRQLEDVFNEMGGDGLNRLMSRYFNEFRKLANEPESEAVRHSVREATQAMINDFHRLRQEIQDVGRHIDSRIEGYVAELNAGADVLRDLNEKIQVAQVAAGVPNDLLDKRDSILKSLASFAEVTTHKDSSGHVNVDLAGIGPLVYGVRVEKLRVDRTPGDERGKADGALEIYSTGGASSPLTHRLQGGKLGALLEVRDQVLSKAMERIDELAFRIVSATNAIHAQGFGLDGSQGVRFFEELDGPARAAELISLSAEIRENSGKIVAAAAPDAPGDNRIALLISGLQSQRILSDGRANADDFYNSIVSSIGVASNRNREGMNQQKDIQTQLNKMRDRISGVSLDEETANLMQYQHTYQAASKVIQVADELVKTVLDLKR
jgi:flagellar hook-associated protein 1 FlgK